MSTGYQQNVQQMERDQPDFYAVLGIPYSATLQDVTRAYRDAMKRVHPDRKHPDQRAAAEEHAKLLNLAFATLSRADSRQAYDVRIRAAAVQDQIMNRYVGGFGPPGDAAHPFGQTPRRELSKQERLDRRRADRSATMSILLIFGGITLIVITLLLIWAAVSALLATVV